jgi:hypothetical protein
MDLMHHAGSVSYILVMYTLVNPYEFFSEDKDI